MFLEKQQPTHMYLDKQQPNHMYLDINNNLTTSI